MLINVVYEWSLISNNDYAPQVLCILDSKSNAYPHAPHLVQGWLSMDSPMAMEAGKKSWMIIVDSKYSCHSIWLKVIFYENIKKEGFKSSLFLSQFYVKRPIKKSSNKGMLNNNYAMVTVKVSFLKDWGEVSATVPKKLPKKSEKRPVVGRVGHSGLLHRINGLTKKILCPAKYNRFLNFFLVI